MVNFSEMKVFESQSFLSDQRNTIVSDVVQEVRGELKWRKILVKDCIVFGNFLTAHHLIKEQWSQTRRSSWLVRSFNRQIIEKLDYYKRFPSYKTKWCLNLVMFKWNYKRFTAARLAFLCGFWFWDSWLRPSELWTVISKNENDFFISS